VKTGEIHVQKPKMKGVIPEPRAKEERYSLGTGSSLFDKSEFLETRSWLCERGMSLPQLVPSGRKPAPSAAEVARRQQGYAARNIQRQARRHIARKNERRVATQNGAVSLTSLSEGSQSTGVPAGGGGGGGGGASVEEGDYSDDENDYTFDHEEDESA